MVPPGPAHDAAPGDWVIRAYSIANLPAEAARDGLEYHVRVYRGGAMSAWLAGAAPRRGGGHRRPVR